MPVRATCSGGAVRTRGASVLGWAQHYAAAFGWRVFPVHAPLPGGGCSCRWPDCRQVGKHPRTEHGCRDATTDREQIARWWGLLYPGANVGIATGRTAAGQNLVVLDLDPAKGGEESLLALARRYGRLSDTVETLTGGGGRHLFFSHPGDPIRNRQKWAEFPGLDIRGAGGYVVAPPSLHASGRRYQWELSSHPDDLPLAPLPAGLLSLLTSGLQHATPNTGRPTGQPERLHDPGPILEGCAWLTYWKRNPQEEPEANWYARASLYARFVGGRDLFHETSRGYPRYSPEETEAKFLHALRDAGPATCATIRGTLNAEDLCSQCPHWSDVTSPLGLAAIRAAHLPIPPLRASCCEVVSDEVPEDPDAGTR